MLPGKPAMKSLLQLRAPTKQALELRKMRIKEMFRCTKVSDREVGRFREWFARMQGYPPERAPKQEVAVALYSYCVRVPDYETERTRDIRGNDFVIKPWKEVLSRGIVCRDNVLRNETDEEYNKRIQGIRALSFDSNTMLGDMIKTRQGMCLTFASLYCMIAEELGLDVKPFLVTKYMWGESTTPDMMHMVPAFIREDGSYILFDPVAGVANAKHKGQMMEKTDLYVHSLVNTAAFSENTAASLHDAGKHTEASRHKKRAHSYVNKALEIAPENPIALCGKANILLNSNRLDGARKYINKAFNANPNSMSSLFAKGILSFHEGNYNDVLHHIDGLLAITPSYTKAFAIKGAALANLKRYKEAHACFDRVLGEDPKNKEVLFNKGIILSEEKKYPQALIYFTRLLEIDNHIPDALFHEALTIKMMGFPERALEHFERLLAEHPNDKNILRNTERHITELRREIGKQKGI